MVWSRFRCIILHGSKMTFGQTQETSFLIQNRRSDLGSQYRLNNVVVLCQNFIEITKIWLWKTGQGRNWSFFFVKNLACLFFVKFSGIFQGTQYHPIQIYFKLLVTSFILWRIPCRYSWQKCTNFQKKIWRIHSKKIKRNSSRSLCISVWLKCCRHSSIKSKKN